MKKIIILTAVIVILKVFCSTAVQLNRVKVIGDDRDDYTFFVLVGAVLSENKDIFVLDGQGLFISKFDWSGKFLKKTGQRGQGPKDFLFPRCLSIYKNRLYLLDAGNNRIAEADLELETFSYIILSKNARFFSRAYILPDGTFVGPFNSIKESRNRIGIIDKDGNVLHHFFNEYPANLGIDVKKIAQSKDKNATSMVRHAMISKETAPIIGVDDKRQEVLVSHMHPENPFKMYVYSNKGKLLKTLIRPLDRKYQFFDLYIKVKSYEKIVDPNSYPKKYFRPFLFGLHIHRGHYLAELWLEEYKRKKELVSRTQLLLIFNPDGTFKEEVVLEKDLRLFSISNDGFVLASKLDEETTKLYVYRLKL